MDATSVDHLLHATGTSNGLHSTNGHPKTNGDIKSTSAKPLIILYGSNTGTCQAFAQRLGSEASSRGFQAEIQDLDSATNAVPKDRPVIIITSSYEGQPPDNAARFIEWLQQCPSGSMQGVNYTVFGCGHRECFHLPKAPIANRS